MENGSNAILAVKSGQASVIGSMLQQHDRRISHIAKDDIGQVVADYMTLTPHSLFHMLAKTSVLATVSLSLAAAHHLCKHIFPPLRFTFCF
jgi:hypothetical protein